MRRWLSEWAIPVLAGTLMFVVIVLVAKWYVWWVIAP